MAGNNNNASANPPLQNPAQRNPAQQNPTQHNTIETDNDGELRLAYEHGVTENRVTFRTGEIANFVADAIVCPWAGPKPENGHYSQLICTAAGPEMLAEAVLKAVGEFRATSPFRDHLQEIIFLFENIDDMEGDELGAYRRERQ